MKYEMQDASAMDQQTGAAPAQPPMPTAAPAMPPTPAAPMSAPPTGPPAHVLYHPVSDLDIAAQYAEMEIQSVSEQFAGASVDGVTQPATIAVASATNGAAVVATEEDSEASKEDVVIESSSESSSDDDDDDDDDDDEDDRNKLRAEIEAAMEKEENKASAPLKTANEVAAIPVREPSVELTADCPIARCGTILNASIPGLMVTIKSDMNAKPLDEGSVLCFEDRTVIGCVDEVFGPVMMPMYLVRFESAEKMPAQAVINTVVFFATEHTMYIVPEKIKDKGTDASNIFDEETDEAVYSDDEAEAAAKRLNRKRNRGGNAEPGQQGATADGDHSNNRTSSHFTDYRQGVGNANSSSSYGGRGGSGGRGGGGRGSGRGGSGRGETNYSHHNPGQVQFQSQSHGGHTHYTQPGYVAPNAPPLHIGYAGQPVSGYAQPPTGYQPPPPPMPYNPMQMNPHHQPPPPPPQHPYPHHQPQHFQPQHQFQQPHMPPPPHYPPQAPPMPGQQQYYQPGPPPPRPYHHGAPQYPPQPTGYYPNAQQQQQPPPPPLPPGSYDHSRQPRN